MVMVNPAELDKALAVIRKTYGERSIHLGGAHQPIDRISTGSLELDYATGGGIPIGRWTRFYGGFSSGKSLVCWNAIGNAQRMGMTCAYYNIEKQYDEGYVRSLGVDVDGLLLVEGTTIEEVGTKLEALLGVVHVHVLDSLSSAVSIDELNAKLEDWQMGLAARAWGKVFRRANERFDDNENVVIMVDQIRDSFGYGGGVQPPGGRFIEHMSSLTMYFRRGSWLFYDGNGVMVADGAHGSTLSGDTESDGVEYLARVEKSRVCQPLRTARFRYDYTKRRFDELYALVKAAKYFEVIEQKGSWWKTPDGESFQGEAKIRAYIDGNPEVRAKIVDAVMARAK